MMASTNNGWLKTGDFLNAILNVSAWYQEINQFPSGKLLYQDKSSTEEKLLLVQQQAELLAIIGWCFDIVCIVGDFEWAGVLTKFVWYKEAPIM